MRTDVNTIRVFISSTFRDMEAEREELIKQIFPHLRRLCEERGVRFVDVDLRWGVTQEQVERGEVLPICLAEIDRCRPYFIGLLGERYGWIPSTDEIPVELMADQPWLAEHLEKSVTELEIVHGVLRNPAMAGRAFFYFRDSAYINKIPPENRAAFVDTDPAARKKLAALKTSVRRSGVAWKEYPDPKALGQEVLRDLTTVIDREFPPGQVPDALQREAMDHEAFAQSRTGVYIGRPEYFARLDRHVDSCEDGPGLVVLGESGSGKSALLANWATRHREEHPDDLVLMHFIGASTHSADWVAMLRRVLQELKRRFQMEQELPEKPESLRSEFGNWLHMASARGRVVLILDALNQLELKDGAQDLVWLPPVLPGNVRLIVSTLPGRPLEELTKRGWPTLTVEPFTEMERRQFMVKYLAQYSKSLNVERSEKIASVPAAANPLYLQALLEELRVFGSHHLLDQRIEHYLAAPTVGSLFERILERLEEDYEKDRAGLVRDTMSLIWVSRRGLPESELLDLLEPGDGRLPQATWSPLFLALRSSLVNRSGYLTFFHSYLGQAVRHRYLTSEAEHDFRMQLADSFYGGRATDRAIEECPWQLAQAGQWERLYNLLAQPLFQQNVWEFSESDALAYWAQIESNTELRRLDAFRPVLSEPDLHRDSLAAIAILLGYGGEMEAAVEVFGHLVKYHRKSGDRNALQEALNNQAAVLMRSGYLDRAVALFEESEQICRAAGNTTGLRNSLINQAVLAKELGDYDKALELYTQAERICRDQESKDGLQACLGNKAAILKERGDLDGAMALHREEERLCRELGNADKLASSLEGQAVILAYQGKLDEAMELHNEAARLHRDAGNWQGLGISIGNQSRILQECGDLQGAMRLLEQGENILRDHGLLAQVFVVLLRKAEIQSRSGARDDALGLLREAEQMSRELNSQSQLALCLDVQANLLGPVDTDRAMALHQEAERIHRALGSQDHLQRSLGWQADILRKQGDTKGAMLLLKEQEEICRKQSHRAGLQECLGSQAAILRESEEYDESAVMLLLKEQEQLCRDMGKPSELSRNLAVQALTLVKNPRRRSEALKLAESAHKLLVEHNLHEYRETVESALKLLRDVTSGTVEEQQIVSLEKEANTLRSRGDLDGAIQALERAKQICEELGRPEYLAACVGQQAQILEERGDLAGAVDLYREVVRICREGGTTSWLVASLSGQADILMRQGALDQAAELLEDAERVCRETGQDNELLVILGNRAIISYTQGDLDAALKLLEEQARVCQTTGDPIRLFKNLATRASMIASDPARLDEAIATAESARDLAVKHGLKDEIGKAEELISSLKRPPDEGKEERAVALSKKANERWASRDLDGALDLLKQVESIYRELGHGAGVANALTGQARVLTARGDTQGALALWRDVSKISRAIEDSDGLKESLTYIAVILAQIGDTSESIANLCEVERICREDGDARRLQEALGNQGVLLDAKGDFDGAMRVEKEAEKICRETGMDEGLLRSLTAQTNILHSQQDLAGAMRLLEEQITVARRLKDESAIMKALHNCVALACSLRDWGTAEARIQEQERIFRDLGEAIGVSKCLSLRGTIARERGSLEEAMTLQKQSEEICRRLNAQVELQSCLREQALVLETRGDSPGAMELLVEQESICRELNDFKGLCLCLLDQAGILAEDPGRRDEAVRLAAAARDLGIQHRLDKLLAQNESLLTSLLG